MKNLFKRYTCVYPYYYNYYYYYYNYYYYYYYTNVIKVLESFITVVTLYPNTKVL